ncbi:MAG: ATP-binding protein [Planctomycetota bacterium]
MPVRKRLRISLARKISLLFGAAVLLVIATTLFVPWLHMTALHEQSLLWQARRVASAAYQAADLNDADWSAVQSRLDERWPTLARDLLFDDAPRPRLVRAGQAGPGFQSDALEHLTRHPGQHYYWRHQRGGRTFRFAMAVRGEPVGPYPDVLRGVIDVTLPIAGDAAVWNAVVTVLAGASGAILAILVFYVVTQRLVLTPVATLRGAAERVTSGDLSVRSMIAGGDEFEDLSDAFNEMLSHLKAAQDDLRTINRSLDIRLGELAETNVALYESNRLKSEFLANVTHELRTPLVSIIGFAELLNDLSKNPSSDLSRLERYAQNILTSGRSLLEIINDLLDIAKIEAGKMQLHISEFSIAELCGDLIDFVRPLADKREQRLVADLAPDLPRFRGDSGKIKQVLYNLLSNGIKFTPPGGQISLTVESADSDRVRLIVQDTGPGIPEAQRGRIFEKFHQIDSSTTREHTGTGLGLAITRDVVQMLGGGIELTPDRGIGATFVVTLPVRFDEEAQRPPIRLT